MEGWTYETTQRWPSSSAVYGRSLIQPAAYRPLLLEQAIESADNELVLSVLFSGIFPVVVGLALLAYGGIIGKACLPDNPLIFERNTLESQVLAMLGVWWVVSAMAGGAASAALAYSAHAGAHQISDFDINTLAVVNATKRLATVDTSVRDQGRVRLRAKALNAEQLVRVVESPENAREAHPLRRCLVGGVDSPLRDTGQRAVIRSYNESSDQVPQDG